MTIKDIVYYVIDDAFKKKNKSNIEPDYPSSMQRENHYPPPPLPLLLRHFSRVRLCATPQTAAHQAPLSLGFSRQEYWSGLPFPSPVGPRDLIIFRFNFMILQGHFTECAGYLYHLIVRCTLAGPPFNGAKIISELKPISFIELPLLYQPGSTSEVYNGTF